MTRSDLVLGKVDVAVSSLSSLLHAPATDRLPVVDAKAGGKAGAAGAVTPGPPGPPGSPTPRPVAGGPMPDTLPPRSSHDCWVSLSSSAPAAQQVYLGQLRLRVVFQAIPASKTDLHPSWQASGEVPARIETDDDRSLVRGLLCQSFQRLMNSGQIRDNANREQTDQAAAGILFKEEQEEQEATPVGAASDQTKLGGAAAGEATTTSMSASTAASADDSAAAREVKWFFVEKVYGYHISKDVAPEQIALEQYYRLRALATSSDWLKLLLSDAIRTPLPFGRWGTLLKQLSLRGHVTAGIPETLDVLVEAEEGEKAAAKEASMTMEREKAAATEAAEGSGGTDSCAGAVERGVAEDEAAAEAWTIGARSVEAMDTAATAVARLKVSIPRFHVATEQKMNHFAL